MWQGKQLADVVLPVELSNGNDGRGHAFWKSSARRKRYERDLADAGLIREPFAAPVRIRLTRILGRGQRLWDADSVLRGSAKELIDSLVAVGWFADDGPRWIVEAVGVQDETQRDRGPAVRLEVFAAEGMPDGRRKQVADKPRGGGNRGRV